MTFRDELDRARKMAIDIGCAYIAQEVSEYKDFGSVLGPEDFEHVCKTIHTLWIKYNYTIPSLVETIGYLMSTKNINPMKITCDMVMENYHEN